jgi:hypothetical protein
MRTAPAGSRGGVRAYSGHSQLLAQREVLCDQTAVMPTMFSPKFEVKSVEQRSCGGTGLSRSRRSRHEMQSGRLLHGRKSVRSSSGNRSGQAQRPPERSPHPDHRGRSRAARDLPVRHSTRADHATTLSCQALSGDHAGFRQWSVLALRFSPRDLMVRSLTTLLGSPRSLDSCELVSRRPCPMTQRAVSRMNRREPSLRAPARSDGRHNSRAANREE